jgi:xylose isomerase
LGLIGIETERQTMIRSISGPWAGALALGVLFFSFGTGPASAGGSAPKAILEDIFGQMDAMCGGDGQGPSYDLEAIAKAYFTPPLIEIVTRDYEQPGALGFDPLVDAQDCQTSDLKLSIVASGETTATGRATFKNMGEDRVIDLQMVKQASGWQVSDIVYGHRSFSLKSEF